MPGWQQMHSVNKVRIYNYLDFLKQCSSVKACAPVGCECVFLFFFLSFKNLQSRQNKIMSVKRFFPCPLSSLPSSFSFVWF